MKKRDYIVLSTVVRSHCGTKLEVATKVGYPLGLVSDSLDNLIKQGYLDEDYFITPKTLEMFRKNTPRRAIILAAGKGLRMLPISHTPKPLLTVSTEVLIERLINQLHRTGIYSITVVVGYQKEKFKYLEGLYNVELVEHPDWDTTDSLHSLHCVAHILDNSYIINGNIWCGENLFSRSEYNSWYAVRGYYDDNSYIRVTREMELIAAEEGGGNAMCGVAYLCEEDAAILRKNLENLYLDPEYKNKEWEKALFDDSGKGIGYANVLTNIMVMPINTYEDLRLLDRESKHLENQGMDLICELFQVSRQEIMEIHALSSGMTNRLMHFVCKGREYLMRIPGEGTGKMIERWKEYEVYRSLSTADMEISDNVIYLNPENGYKVTEFLSDARTCNPEAEKDVKMCMKHLRNFHNQNIQVDFSFDLREQLEHYEKLRQDSMPFSDYDITRGHIDELLERVEKLPKTFCLSHIDSVYDNFLIVKNHQGEEQVRLIDWEYAGQSDPHLDIAMFCIYAYYDKEQVDKIIEIYFEENYSQEIKQKIYCYIAISGLVWTNWCEYKGRMGVKYGAYEMRQYQYAKQFYEYVIDLWP